MSVSSPFLINSVSSLLLILIKSSTTDLKCFWPFAEQQETALSEAKTKVSH